MSSILKMEETDYGTKRKTKRALDRFWKAIPREFRGAIRKYVHDILRDAYRFCPKDTGTLANTIRIEKGGEGEYTHYEVKKSNYKLGKYRIVAGGQKIHPRTKRLIDYAQAVHDGHHSKAGRWVKGTPFLSMAFAVGDRKFKHLMDKKWNNIVKEWIKD